MRYALVTGSAAQVAAYLPNNYKVLSADEGTNTVLVTGRDTAGWTLHEYVLPRLASGLHFGREVKVPPCFVPDRDTVTV